MRTTVILDDAVYEKLVQRAVKEKGSAKKMSETLNEMLRRTFAREEVPENMFGSLKGKIDVKGLREEGEPH